MPRTKPAPSRKRPLDEQESTTGTADIVELVETAEISNWKARIESGACRQVDMDDAPPPGLACFDLPTSDFDVLRELHAAICRRLDGLLTGWGGVGDTSGRQRGYGYLKLPGVSSSLAESHYASSHMMKEYTGETASVDLAANRRASVLLGDADLPADVLTRLPDVLTRLTTALSPLLPERYRRVVRPELLVAAQPNLHRQRRYLRPHLDEPLHDGFGVVIVTVAIAGKAKILLRAKPSPTAEKELPALPAAAAAADTDGTAADARPLQPKEGWWFALQPGQAYALSGDVRNAYLHGVLAEEGAEGEERESLNLRFGLHSAGKEGDFPAWHEVERHWEPSAGR